jgi:hypothetical protein
MLINQVAFLPTTAQLNKKTGAGCPEDIHEHTLQVAGAEDALSPFTRGFCGSGVARTQSQAGRCGPTRGIGIDVRYADDDLGIFSDVMC